MTMMNVQQIEFGTDKQTITYPIAIAVIPKGYGAVFFNDANRNHRQSLQNYTESYEINNKLYDYDVSLYLSLEYPSNLSRSIVKRINKLFEFVSVDIFSLLPYPLKFWYCHYRFRKAFPTRPNFSIYHISFVKTK